MKRGVTSGKRLSHEPPAVTAKLGWRYHHIGIPYTQPRAREHYVAHLGVHVSGFETSRYGIEWIRFGKPSALGAVTGLVAGLGTITPASGYVGPAAALLIGTTGTGILSLLAHAMRLPALVDVALVLALLAAIGGIAFAKRAWQGKEGENE